MGKWRPMNGNESIDCCVSLHSCHIHIHQCMYIYIRSIYIVGLNLRRFTCKLMGRPNLRTCSIIGVLFESTLPATLSWNGLERHKKNVAKAKWKLWNKYTKRAIRDLWQALMATQIFVKWLPKYLFNQSETGIVYFEYIHETLRIKQNWMKSPFS